MKETRASIQQRDSSGRSSETLVQASGSVVYSFPCVMRLVIELPMVSIHTPDECVCVSISSRGLLMCAGGPFDLWKLVA